MHGRPRVKKDAPEAVEKARAHQQKALLYGKLAKEVLQRRRAQRYDPESLPLSARLLELNPEVYTLWNYRREALQGVLMGDDVTAARAAAAEELALTEAAIRSNLKSYAAWHHRAWVVEKGHCDLSVEMKLLKRLLQLDERNFHAWRYWRKLLKLKGVSAEEALRFTTEKVEENFSNYSAWHSRSKLLPAAHAETRTVTLAELMASDAAPATTSAGVSGAVPEHILDEEYALVKNAFFTLPEDQSAWFYHRWLLGNSLAAAQAARGGPQEQRAAAALQERLQTEVAMCEELLEVEPDAKWPLLTLARLREAQAVHAADDVPDSRAASASGAAEQAQQIYWQLQGLDPMRQGYYADAQQGKAPVVLRP